MKTLENTEGAINNGEPRETGNTGYARYTGQRQTNLEKKHTIQKYELDTTIRQHTQLS